MKINTRKDQTQPTSVNSSCHEGIQRNAFLLKTSYYCNIIYTYYNRLVRRRRRDFLIYYPLIVHDKWILVEIIFLVKFQIEGSTLLREWRGDQKTYCWSYLDLVIWIGQESSRNYFLDFEIFMLNFFKNLYLENH